MHISVYNSLEDKSSMNVERINKLLRNSYTSSDKDFKNIVEVHYNGQTIEDTIKIQGEINYYMYKNYSNMELEYTVSPTMLRTMLSGFRYLSGLLSFNAYSGPRTIKVKPEVFDTFVSRDIMFEKTNDGLGDLNYIISLLYGRIMYGDYILKYIPSNKYITSTSTLYSILRKYTSNYTTELDTYKIPKEYKTIKQITLSVTKKDGIYLVNSKRFSAGVKYFTQGKESLIDVLVKEFGKSKRPELYPHLPLYAILSNIVRTKEEK